MAANEKTFAPRTPYRGAAGPGSVGAAVWVSLAEQTRRFRRLRQRVLRGKDPEDLHQLRVTLRRFRAALELGREALDLPPAVDGQALRRISRALGRLRDVDVALEHLDGLVPVAKGDQGRALDQLRARLRRRQRAIRRTIRRDLDEPEVERAVNALRRWVREPRFFPFAFRPLSATARGMLAPAERAVQTHPGWNVVPGAAGRFATAEDPILHDLRKRVKDLRYRLEILSRPRPELAERRLAMLRRTQDHLGGLHDLETIRAFLDSPLKGASPSALDWVRRHLATRARAATTQWLETRSADYNGIVSTADGEA